MKLVVANWKSNPATLEEAIALAKDEDIEGAVICPPFVYLEEISGLLANAILGAQDVAEDEGGPHTGEISAAQLENLEVSYVIVGHSERRALGETDEMINKKMGLVTDAGMTAILCVGESLDIHNQGEQATLDFVSSQLAKALEGISQKGFVTIAYEPIWAISTSQTGLEGTPDEAEQIIAKIKTKLADMGFPDVRVLYGGSVDASDAGGYLSKDIDGVLVGGASLKADEFKQIIKYA